jgi:hypothetical protein
MSINVVGPGRTAGTSGAILGVGSRVSPVDAERERTRRWPQYDPLAPTPHSPRKSGRAEHHRPSCRGVSQRLVRHWESHW